ncbi:DUF4382 domain-containing protein [Prolixibacteraceae bacterium]|nr:DUF4382 domain-containing protein [Prolixibacteraceae bacterium]
MKKILFSFIALMILSLGLFSCNDDDIHSGQATLNVQLTDVPGDYEQVNIDIQDVRINLGEDDSGWTSIGEVNTGVYNLLEFTAGNDTLLVSGGLPAGTYEQIRLVLGTLNTIVIGGVTYDLDTPSAQQSGLKIQINQTLEGGVAYNLILDFDVDKSIVEKGNGSYSLKPVIRATFDAQSGAIQGQVQNDAEGVAYAIQGTDTIASSYLDAGKFVIRAVSAGQYKVDVAPLGVKYINTTLDADVEVVTGQTAVVEGTTLDEAVN